MRGSDWWKRFDVPVALVAAAALLLMVHAGAVSAQARVALVIGNASYAHAPALGNPINDAVDMDAALGRLGFAVTRLENADYAGLRRGLLEFQRAASAAEVAVVFYAGHGIEVDQRNFLVPVDARLASDQDVEFEAVPLELVSRAVERASGLRLVILDACRENPFAVQMQRTGATRSIGRGLARVEPSGETLVAYAAKEGTEASDGSGRNSPYSEALLAHLEEPGLEVGLMFRKVRDTVMAATGGRQEPFVYGSLSSKGVYLKQSLEIQRPIFQDIAESSKTTITPRTNDANRVTAEQLATERLFWESVKDSGDPADIAAYLEQYPSGTYTSLAHNRLKRLTPSSPPDVESAPTGREDRLQFFTRRTWKTTSLRWAIELNIDGDRVEAIVSRRTGTRGGIRCRGKVNNVGRIRAWCLTKDHYRRILEGTFPHLKLRDAGSGIFSGVSFVFELDRESSKKFN